MLVNLQNWLIIPVQNFQWSRQICWTTNSVYLLLRFTIFKVQAIFGHQSLPTKYLCHKNFLFPSCPWADQNIPSIWLNSIWACYRWEILWPAVNVLTRYFNLWNRWLVAFGLVALLNEGWVWTFFSHRNIRT